MLTAACGFWDRFPGPCFPRSRYFLGALQNAPRVRVRQALGLGRKPSVVTADFVVLEVRESCVSLAGETGLGHPSVCGPMSAFKKLTFPI